MKVSDRRLLEQLLRALGPQHEVSLVPGPDRLVVSDVDATVEVVVVTVESGASVVRKFRNMATGHTYGPVEDIWIVAELVRSEVTASSRRALFEAHEMLLLHRPNEAGWCVPCGIPMPCPDVTLTVKVLDIYGHLDQVDGLKAEEGAHVCRDWLYPYRP